VLDAATNDPALKQALVQAAVAAEKEIMTPFFQWRYNGKSAGNGWNSPVNNAQWGTDYLNRAATAKSNMYDNKPDETKYIYTDFDTQGQPLDGKGLYTITFPKGQLPLVKGFWSLTLRRAPLLPPERAQTLLTRHQEQDPEIQPGRLAYAFGRREGSRQRQGKQLATGTQRHLLAM
jgi:Protein of unknown function (DUF1214)